MADWSQDNLSNTSTRTITAAELREADARVELECARVSSRGRLGLILATVGAVLLGGGLLDATVLHCSTLNLTIVLGMMSLGMVLLLGGGIVTALAMFASRKLGPGQSAQRTRRRVLRYYIIIIFLVAGVLAMAYAITMRSSGAATG